MIAAIKWECVHGVFVVASTGGDVTDDMWDALLDDLLHARANIYFAVALGNTNVNPVQRRKVVDLVKSKSMTARVVTDSSLTRGLVTAVSWFVPGIRSFSTEHKSKAIASLELPNTQTGDVTAAVERLTKECLRSAA